MMTNDEKAALLHRVLREYGYTPYSTYDSMPMDAQIHMRMVTFRFEDKLESDYKVRVEELEEDLSNILARKRKKSKKKLRKLKDRAEKLNIKLLQRLRLTANDTDYNPVEIYPAEARQLLQLIDEIKQA